MLASRIEILKSLNLSSTTNKSESWRRLEKSVVRKVCAGLAAAGHSYSKDKNLIQAGMAFGSQVYKPIGYGNSMINAVCNGILDTGSSFLAGEIAGAVVDGALALMGPVGWPIQCGMGVLEYFAGDLLSDLINDFWDWALSLDPNDIIGPDSYGPENFIWNKEPFAFKIRFENIENASAPAQVVKVTSKIDDKFDIRSVRLTAFGFNRFARSYDVSLSSSYFSDTVEYDSEMPAHVPDRYEIRVVGSVDVVKREINWQFRCIDRTTGIWNY